MVKRSIIILVWTAILLGSDLDFKLPVYKDSLKNGLLILIYQDTLSALVSTQLWYKVGSYYEKPGITGISHLLEHMAFKGSKNYPKERASEIIRSLGGITNAFTSQLYTCYWTDLAKDKYEVALKIEADRMKNLSLLEKEFEPEKKVVMEERRLQENAPFSSLWESFYATAYLTHPFRNPVIGWMEDLKKITQKDLVKWYQENYHPQNALLVLAGNVKIEEAKKIIKKYFSKIKPQKRKEETFSEIPQMGERKIVIKRDIKTPMMLIGYKTCAISDPEYYPLEVIARLLFLGKSSRLVRKLVIEEGLAINVFGGSDIEKDTGIFYIGLISPDTLKLRSAEKMIYDELDILMNDTISEREMTRVKNRIIADFVFRRDRVRSIGFQLARSELIAGSYEYIEEYPKMIEKVTKESLKETARKFFNNDRKTIALLLPK